MENYLAYEIKNEREWQMKKEEKIKEPLKQIKKIKSQTEELIDIIGK
jgi:hypothetical protein